MELSKLPRLLESRPMAKLLRVPDEWLRNQVKSGALPGVSVDDDRAIFSPRDVERALADRCKYDPRPMEGNR